MLKIGGIALLLPLLARDSRGAPPAEYYMPTGAAAKFVSADAHQHPQSEVVIITRAVAIKETGPASAIAKFGEVYDFSPSFIAVRRDVPTMLTFWNLQPDDQHDVMLVAPDSTVLMHQLLPPLSKRSFVLTFHRTGLYDFRCVMHQPEMNGQIEVIDSSARN